MKKSILVVDDEAELGKILKKVLEREGYRVVTVENGEEAVRRFKEDPFELLITDLRMPVRGGAEMLSEIERLNTQIKVIVLTGYPLDPSTQKKVSEGRYLHFEKPFENTLLLEKVKELLSPK